MHCLFYLKNLFIYEFIATIGYSRSFDAGVSVDLQAHYLILSQVTVIVVYNYRNYYSTKNQNF